MAGNGQVRRRTIFFKTKPEPSVCAWVSDCPSVTSSSVGVVLGGCAQTAAANVFRDLPEITIDQLSQTVNDLWETFAPHEVSTFADTAQCMLPPEARAV